MSNSKFKIQNSKLQVGFTLLETIVAFAVIFAALVGPVSLITRGLIDVTFAKNKLIALNLAQEGIELVRLARDNNVLCDYLDGGAAGSWKWNHEPGQGAGATIDPPSEEVVADLESDSFDLVTDNCGGATLTSTDFNNYNFGNPEKLRVDSSGFYQYASGSESPFARRITVNTRIVSGEMDRMDVISEVTWDERGLSRTVTLKDALYNWR